MHRCRDYKEIPEWKKELTCAYYHAIESKTNHLTGLYLAMEQIATKYMEAGTMPDGEEFVIHLANIATLKLTFHLPYSEVSLFDNKTDTWNVILSKEESAEIEKHQVLDYYDKLLAASGLSIGPPAPKELYAYLVNCKTGQMVNFSQGNSYVCLKNNDRGMLYLQKYTEGQKSSFSIDDIKNSETIKLPLVPATVEQFYQENCKIDRTLTATKVQLDTFAQEYLNSLYASLPLAATKKILLGKEVLYLTRTGFRKYAWKDKQGKRLSEEAVRLILGHIHTRGIEREYRHKKPTAVTKFNDLFIEQQIDEALSKGNFADVYELLSQYILTEKQSLTITNKGYHNENGDYIATGYAFKYDSSSDSCRIFRLEYENNDLNGVELLQEEVQKEEFLAFYRERYQETKTMLVEQTLYDLEQKYGLPKTETVKNSRTYVANILAGKNIALADGKEIHTEDKATIAYSEEEIDALLDSFLDKT